MLEVVFVVRVVLLVVVFELVLLVLVVLDVVIFEVVVVFVGDAVTVAVIVTVTVVIVGFSTSISNPEDTASRSAKIKHSKNFILVV